MNPEPLYLFFDTETTGVPILYNEPVENLDNWPRLVELAWILTDGKANELQAHALIIKPEGFEIPQQATNVHGISTQQAHAEGYSLFAALSLITSDIKRASVLIAHNMAYDEKILGAEYLRRDYPNHVAESKRQCTMLSSTAYCKIPGKYGFKWPSLQELHEHLFDEQFTGAHRALADVRACAKCYFELKRLNIINV